MLTLYQIIPTFNDLEKDCWWNIVGKGEIFVIHDFLLSQCFAAFSKDIWYFWGGGGVENIVVKRENAGYQFCTYTDLAPWGINYYMWMT